jgi:hypothetical protein
MGLRGRVADALYPAVALASRLVSKGRDVAVRPDEPGVHIAAVPCADPTPTRTVVPPKSTNFHKHRRKPRSLG